MRELELLMPTLFGLEGLCADELRRLGLEGVRAENGRVRCKASPGDIPRVNLNLRTGERVLLVVGSMRPGTSTPCSRGPGPCPGRTLSPGTGRSPSRGTASVPSSTRCLPARPC